MLCRKITLLLLSLVGFTLFGLIGCQVENNKRQQKGRSTDAADWSFTSNLPIVLVDTFGDWIRDEPKIPARLKIIHDASGKPNTLLSTHVHFEGKIGIEVRGKSSQMYPKGQYGLEVRDDSDNGVDISLLEMPAESDWILHGPYSDKTLMRNFLAYDFSNRIGRYAARTRFVEVFVNDAGDAEIWPRHYMGVYLLMEKIKRGSNRVDVQVLASSQQEPLDLTGGYILKIDKVDPHDRYFFTDYGTRLTHVYPKGNQVTPAQQVWIADYINAFEAALIGPNFTDSQHGYAKYIDIPSFVDYLIINELCKNVDAYRISTFLHKDRNGKLKMGPVWDFNISLGNADYYGGWRHTGWMCEEIPQREGYPVPFWWNRLLQDENFVAQLAARWKVVRQDAFDTLALVDQTATYLDAAQRRNFDKWPILGRYVWPNPRPYPRTYEAEVKRLRSWLTNRIAWIDENIGR